VLLIVAAGLAVVAAVVSSLITTVFLGRCRGCYCSWTDGLSVPAAMATASLIALAVGMTSASPALLADCFFFGFETAAFLLVLVVLGQEIGPGYDFEAA
jgi:hypothetical protein